MIIDSKYVSGNISTLVKKLEQKIEKLEKIKARLLSDTAELDIIIKDICNEFGNCDTCPIAGMCSIMLGVLCRVIDCDKCPRLRVCLKWGLLELRRRRYIDLGGEEDGVYRKADKG
jgi:predicted transcriptional regulator